MTGVLLAPFGSVLLDPDMLSGRAHLDCLKVAFIAPREESRLGVGR